MTCNTKPSAASCTTPRLTALIACLVLLCGCSNRPPVRSAPPPTAVHTEPIQRELVSVQRSQESAGTRIQTITKEVERLIPITDTATSETLRFVQSELLRVTVDLRDAQDAVARAEAERVKAQSAADNLLVYGETMRQTADANAEGWQKSEARGKKAIAQANKLQTYVACAFGAAAGFGVSLITKLLPMPYNFIAPVVVGLITAGATWFLI